jgi:ferredoxin--NADP+ reductase
MRAFGPFPAAFVRVMVKTMNLILEAADVAPGVRRIRVRAPRVAAHHRAGQFVILRVTSDGERIPLTIADSDVAEGSITLYVQAVGRTTRLLNRLEAGDAIHDIAGPLGKPTEIESYGRAVVVGGGLGIAIAYPVALALRRAGNEVDAILGARDETHLFLEAELQDAGIRTRPCTDDGSYGRHGFVTDELQAMLDAGEQVDVVFAAGPVVMMKFVAAVTRPHDVKTLASLNPIMVDGTGMCGGCRVVVGGRTRFACVDGPEFDAHGVDFEILELRNQAYREFEQDRDHALDVMEPCEIDDLLASSKTGESP